METIFFSQAALDRLISEGKIRLEKNILTLLTPDQPSFELEPAFRVTGTADNGPDPHGLVGQTSYEKDLKAADAEIYLDSIIYRETAYSAEPGFIGKKEELMEKLSDVELLARFLLDNLMP